MSAVRALLGQVIGRYALVGRARTNLAAGALTARFRRKHLLVAGWLIGVPVPFALAWAPSWGWIVAANVLLGINQGLTWSMTVNMKIDLVGPARRGLVTGLNEAAGYAAVGATALLTGYLATAYGLRPTPELIGVVFVAAGLVLSLSARDTAAHLALELAQHPKPTATSHPTSLATAFTRASWHDRSLRGASQAGAGQQPQRRPDLERLPPAVHPPRPRTRRHRPDQGPLPPAVGHRPDPHRPPRRPQTLTGMLVQAAGFILALALLHRPLLAGVLSATALSIGTAMVYPALIASISDHTHPNGRANALGAYRFWRDIGYAVGALVAGVLADALGLNATVIAAAVLTAASGILAARWISEHPARPAPGNSGQPRSLARRSQFRSSRSLT